jgi:hypothetical protein
MNLQPCNTCKTRAALAGKVRVAAVGALLPLSLEDVPTGSETGPLMTALVLDMLTCPRGHHDSGRSLCSKAAQVELPYPTASLPHAFYDTPNLRMYNEPDQEMFTQRSMMAPTFALCTTNLTCVNLPENLTMVRGAIEADETAAWLRGTCSSVSL